MLLVIGISAAGVVQASVASGDSPEALRARDGSKGLGIVHGLDDDLYHPDWPVIRDQMAVYISRAVAGGDENVPEFTGTPTFPDVGTDFWALDYVEYAVSQNVVTGYDDGYYHPENVVTRDQMAVYVARALGCSKRVFASKSHPRQRTCPTVHLGRDHVVHVGGCQGGRGNKKRPRSRRNRRPLRGRSPRDTRLPPCFPSTYPPKPPSSVDRKTPT
jgi:hypothetical protein